MDLRNIASGRGKAISQTKAVTLEPFKQNGQGGQDVVIARPIVTPQGSEPMSDKRLYLTYMDVKKKLSHYIKDTPLLTCVKKPFTVNDVIAASILSGTNMYLVGSRGTGKTLLAEAMYTSIFGDLGFYLRGDPHFNIKDLFMRLNLHGKTDEEVYGIALEALKYHFALIDELNRMPGIIQNQFLNLLDGYVEIRGKKYYLGSNEYMLAAATGNPPTNGEYTGVFDEDNALLDRILLTLNVDEIEHAGGDIARIMREDMEKNRIPRDNLAPDVVDSSKYLRRKRIEDPQNMASFALLAEFIYHQFRYVTIGGKRVDKIQNDGWRDALRGQHSGGDTISYVSDISVRTLKGAAKLAFAIFKIAEIESDEHRRLGKDAPTAGMEDLIDAYLDALKLALTYDRRFIPADLPQSIGKSHAETLEATFDKDLMEAIDVEVFKDAMALLEYFYEALDKGDTKLMAQVMASTQSSTGEHPLVKTAYGIMDSEMRRMQNMEIENAIRASLAKR